MHTTNLLKYFRKFRYLVIHEIAEFVYSFTLILHSRKVEIKHLIWDFQIKNVWIRLTKYKRGRNISVGEMMFNFYWCAVNNIKIK